MVDTKKVTIEQGDKRITMEQGVSAPSSTPKWDTLKVNVKEGFADKATIFGTTFMKSLAPCLLISIILVIIIFIIVKIYN
jgi:hypothetical protein